MLKLEDIRFPITFYSRGVGTITFKDWQGRGVRSSGEETSIPLDRYIAWHNERYSTEGDYAYEMTPDPAEAQVKLPSETGVPYRISVNGVLRSTDYFSLTAAAAAAKQVEAGEDVLIVRLVAHIKEVTTREVEYV